MLLSLFPPDHQDAGGGRLGLWHLLAPLARLPRGQHHISGGPAVSSTWEEIIRVFTY